MSTATSIEWTRGDDGTPGATWPIVTGCDHISEGCGLPRWDGDLPGGCYAAKLTSGRLKNHPAYAGLAVGGRFTGEVRTHEDRLAWPLKWRKPRRIFVCDMADLFHDKVPADFIAKVFGIMAATPRHTFMVLTKRHARLRSLLSDREFRCLVYEHAWAHDQGRGLDPYRYASEPHMPTENEHVSYPPDDSDWWPLTNVWVGVSAETQKWAGIRIPALLRTPAAVRFVSAEPLLGPLDLSSWMGALTCGCGGEPGGATFGCSAGCMEPVPGGLDWVITGGESGPKARPAHPDWFRSLRDQCTAAGVAYFHKQNGEWISSDRPKEQRAVLVWPGEQGASLGHFMWRPGKKAAGRELDGRTWDEFPQPPDQSQAVA